MKTVTKITAAEKAKVTRVKNRARHNLCSDLAGAWTGGIVPIITFAVAHGQAPSLTIQWTAQTSLWIVVLGGLIYSAPTVAEWFARYAGRTKAWGFVASLEIAMTWTDMWTATPALLTLIGINAYVLADKFRND